MHQVLFYDVPQDVMEARCMKRAETSGRADDNAETIKKRVQTYFDNSLPVIDYYKQFGKVNHINALSSISEVYAQTKHSLLPQSIFLMGPKACGKTSVGTALSARTNLDLIDFTKWIKANSLVG